MSAEINSNVSGAGAGGVSPVETSAGVSSASPSAINTYQQSTISKSEELMAAEMIALMMVSGIPLLIPPKDISSPDNVNGIGSTGSLAAQYLIQDTEQQKQQIIQGVLDKWLENIKEIAKEAKEEDLRRQTVDLKPGPKSATEYLEYIMQASAIQREQEFGEDSNPLAAQFASTYNQWMTPGMVSGVDQSSSVAASGKYPDSSFVAGCLVCSPEAFRSAIGADSALLGIQLSVSPVADALTGTGPVSGLPVDAQAAAAMIAAMLYNGALYKANIDTLVTAVQKGTESQPQNLAFAMNYAKQVTAIVTANVENSEPMPQETAGRNNLIRLMLASMGLNLLYRQAYGGMTGVEMEKLINGADISDIPDPEVRAQIGQLVSLIRSYLPKEAGARSTAIAALCEQVDDRESADSMLETTNLFAGMLNVKGINASRLGSATA